jgi:hypothetical protein
MACERCPCPRVCRAKAIYCEWVLRDPVDPVHLRAICADRPQLIGPAQPASIVPLPPTSTARHGARPCCGGAAPNPYDYLLSPPESTGTAAVPPADANPA